MEKVIRQVKMEPRRVKLQRVAAYARVSSGKEAMLHSLSEQISYYSDRIQSHPGWEYAGVYADADYTGTKDSRPEFQRLLADCRIRYNKLRKFQNRRIENSPQNKGQGQRHLVE